MLTCLFNTHDSRADSAARILMLTVILLFFTVVCFGKSFKKFVGKLGRKIIASHPEKTSNCLKEENCLEENCWVERQHCSSPPNQDTCVLKTNNYQRLYKVCANCKCEQKTCRCSIVLYRLNGQRRTNSLPDGDQSATDCPRLKSNGRDYRKHGYSGPTLMPDYKWRDSQHLLQSNIKDGRCSNSHVRWCFNTMRYGVTTFTIKSLIIFIFMKCTLLEAWLLKPICKQSTLIAKNTDFWKHWFNKQLLLLLCLLFIYIDTIFK